MSPSSEKIAVSLAESCQLTLPIRCFCNKESRCLSAFFFLSSALLVFLPTTCAQVFKSEREFSFTASRGCARNMFLLSGCFTLLRESFLPPLFGAESDNPDGPGISSFQGMKEDHSPWVHLLGRRPLVDYQFLHREMESSVRPVCLSPRRVPRLASDVGSA